MKQAKIKKSKIVIVGIALVLLCLLAVTLYNVWHRQELSDLRDEALVRLERDAGEYDERSIVLQNTSRARAEKLAELLGATLRITSNGKYATLTLPEGTTILDVYRDPDNLAYLPELSTDYQASVSDLGETSEQSLRLPSRPSYAVSDAYYAYQGYLDYLNMKNAWNQYSGFGVTVAVIDTGIDTDHPEFAGRISEYSYNATEDKIVKDYLLPGGGYDWSLIEDEQGHGTAVTGVIAAGMNSDGIVGIAPSVTILTIKAECDENGRFKRTSDLVFGLYYAIERDVDVVNMSFGGPSNEFADATQLAVDSDIICVAAAGNESTSTLTYPAADPHVIGVGALGDGWTLADYSNYGENVDLVAPGTTYTSTTDGKYKMMNGTSLAAPIVSGAIALLKQADYTYTYTTFDSLTELLFASCYDLGDLGCDYYYGYGALDVSAFLLEERGKVTFDMLTDELENTEQLFIRNHTLQNMPEPERPYAIFDGWYYDPHCLEEYNLYVDRFSTDLTLYAKWVNGEDGIPFTYVELEDGTVEIRSYTGHRRFITVPSKIDGRTVSSIGDFAFSDERNLREVGLPSTLTHIGRYAFSGCSNLLGIEIPTGVSEIGEGAFSHNTRLASVAFLGASKLKTIGESAFAFCSKLERIELPASLTAVNGSAFAGASSLYSIGVQKGNTHFLSSDGVLFNIGADTLVAYPAARAKSYTLPSSVRTIGESAFAYAQLETIDLSGVVCIEKYAFTQTALREVTLPDSVTAMGEEVFAFAQMLSRLEIGQGLTDIPISAFSFTTALREVTIPKGIVSIGDGAFAKSALERVSFSSESELVSIGQSAFSGCNLYEIDIPASVSSIGDSAFAWSEDSALYNPLSRVGFAETGALRSIGDEAFAWAPRLSEIDLPKGLSSIGDSAFCGSGLASVSIPASVTSLGNGAFERSEKLSEIKVESGNTVYHDLDGVVYDLANTAIYAYPAGKESESYTLLGTTEIIMPRAFSGTVYLRSTLLPEGLVQISEYAFAYSKLLSSMQIPDSVLQIGRYAFSKTPALSSVTFTENAKLPRISASAFAYSGLTSFTVPASVSTMAQGAFEGCENLASIVFAEGSRLDIVPAYMLDGCSRLESITFLAGSALQSIAAHGFEGMASLLSIDFGDAKLENIDNFAFRFCENLAQIDLPETVSSIGRYAFYGCKALSSLALPASIEHIGSYAFLGTDDLALYFAASLLPERLDESWDHGTRGYYVGVTEVLSSDDFEYARLSSGGIAILKYLGTDTQLDLTAFDFGGPVTAIGGSAFAGSSLCSIVLPDTLIEIQAEAFMYSKIESIVIPGSVSFIGRSAFAHSELASLSFASGSRLAVIEQYAFESCDQLTSLSLPASLAKMGTGVFMESGLESLVFEDGIALTEIPDRAFYRTKLTSLVLPDSVTLVGHHAFREVETLASLSFGQGDGIRLMSYAFYHTGLTSLSVPANVTYIGEYCFVALTSLSEISVDPENPSYTAVDGLLLTKNGRKLITVPAGRTGSLTLPLSVEEIGFGAFEESSLSEILFHEDANILSFGYRSFFGAKKISEIRVPKSVVSIDYYAFAYCENLASVIFEEGSRLKGIYEGAFLGDVRLESLLIPDAIVEISDFAFYGCSRLSRLPIGEQSGVKGIYDYAFAYTGLSGDFVLPETLFDVGSYAFLGTKVERVTVPDTNKEQLVIGIGAFEDCTRLSEITLPFVGASYEDQNISWFGYIFGAGAPAASATYLPESLKTVTVTEGLTTLYRYAFAYCPGLETIHLPHSISAVWDDAFFDTTAMHEFTNVITVHGKSIDANNPVSDRDIGRGLTGNLVLSEIEDCNRISLSSMPYLESVSLPEGITEIDLAYCTALKSVSLPDSLTKIGDIAFMGCTGLVEITLPSALTEIAPNAFYECTSLYKVVNRSSLALEIGSEGNGYVACYAKLLVNPDGSSVSRGEYIETSDGFRFTVEDGKYRLVAYMGSSRTVTLPDDIMGCAYELYGFTGAAKVIVPEGVSAIGAYAFQNSSIVEIRLPASLRSIGDRAFESCAALKRIDLPLGLETVGAVAFGRCTSLEEIVFPDSVTELGSSVLGGCRNLVRATLPEGITVLYGTFANCERLEEVQIPESVEVLSGTFNECRSLKAVQIPDGVWMIDSNTFTGCSSLERLVLPSRLRDLGSNAFSDQTEIVFAGNEHFRMIDGVLYNADVTRLIYVTKSVSANLELPNTVRDIGQSAFAGRAGLISVVLPSGMTNIPGGMFENCTNLVRVEIPESVTAIGGGAFNGCSSLADVSLPTNIKRIEGATFRGCTALRSIDLPADLEYLGNSAFAESGLESIEIPDSTALDIYVFGGCENLTSVTLPKGLTAIPQGLFTNCSALREIEIPDSVTSIESQAFCECTRLSSIELPAGLASIEERAFGGCVNLYEVINHSALQLSFESWDHGGVANYAKVITDRNGNATYLDPESKFTYIDTPDGFRFIYDGTYRLIAYTGSDETITLPESISGSPYALYYFTGGVHVSIPSGIESISYAAFAGNKTLQSVSIPDTVTRIEGSAFLGCTALGEIVIPDGVTYIGDGAFFGCTSLGKIDILTRKAEIRRSVFSKTAYVSDPGNWKNGMLVIDGYLIDVAEDLRYLTGLEEIIGVAPDAYSECYSLKNALFDGAFFVSYPTNAETYVISDLKMLYPFIENTVTLKNVIILGSVDPADLQDCRELFTYYNVTGITIYVESREEDLRWDDNFPGWSNGNKVVYGDSWIYVDFYDANRNLLSHTPVRTSEVIRRPVLDPADDAAYDYECIGWDLDGDGEIDSLPATSLTSLSVYPVIEKSLKTYTVTFEDPDTGEIYQTSELPYGATVAPPADPAAAGKVFEGWRGYTEGMTVSGDLTFRAKWHHHDLTTHEGKDASCTEIGWYAYETCSRCEYNTYVEIPALDHAMYTSDIQSPSCTASGLRVERCSGCGIEKVEEIPALGHDVTVHDGKDASCTEIGWYAYETCSRCEYNTYVEIPALGHDEIVHEGKDASCTESGWYAETCSRCEYNTYVEIPALGHDEIAHEGKDASCTESGWYAYETCSRCEYNTYVEIPALDHAMYTSDIQSPSCTASGLRVERCSGCGIEKVEEIPALGHDVTAHEGKDASCTESGWNAYVTCSRCEYSSYEEIPALGHDEIAHEGKDASCTESGWNAYVTCSRCEYSSYEEIPALGHDEIAHEGKDASCTESGWYAYVTCSRCEYSSYEEIPVLDHATYTNDIQAPSCTASGLRVERCSGCGIEKVEEIPALGHDEIAHEGKDASCTESGWNAYVTCSRCEYSTYLEIPALGHDKIAHAEHLSSCTEDGWYAYETCSRCDYSTYLEMPSLGGHRFGSWIEKVAPTPTAPGEEERKCGRCEHFETREITYLEYFERAVEKVSSASTIEASYGAIYSALTVYAELSSEDKAAASDAYQTLLAAIDTYNARATAANEELKTASEVAFMPMSAYFGFLAALWFLLKRKLM